MPHYLVITGGSDGIGKASIARFLAAGWQAINISRSACDLAGVKNITMDLADTASIEKQQASLSLALKNVESLCLVHNAAFYEPDEVKSLAIKKFRTTLEVNVIAPVILNQMLIPYMPAGSSILYIGSTLAEKAVPGSASYTISKHAVVGLMRATCQDLMEQSIRSCCICPGLVDTKLLSNTMSENVLGYLLKEKVIGKRLIAPSEIADVIYFCATTPVINGAVIPANLGQVAD